MIKWVVFWTVINTWMVPCPQQEPYYDDYGRYHPAATIRTHQICYDSGITNKFKEFTNYDEAKKFMDEGMNKSGLKDFRIEKVE